ncbi:MAG: hypothetical protein IJD86_11595 [Clostridia bacterium]|nr:hypothetical protein [Clostridia bacterium]
MYDEDGIMVTWMGMRGDDFSDGKADRFAVILTNQTENDYYFAMIRAAVNGIGLDLDTNRGSELLESGLSMYTGGSRSWLFDEEDLGIMNITHANEIYIRIDLFLKEQSNKYREDEIVRSIQVRFPVDEDIP